MIKKIAIISFTENGSKTAERVAGSLRKHGYEVETSRKYKNAVDAADESLDEWTRKSFKEGEALIYIGAAGIAVRAAAPYIKSKTEDPAVLVVDEQGIFCIPLLSGHIGRANELAAFISAKIGAVPVITTATDLNRKWAVDIFAVKNGLRIHDMEKAKAISAKLLSEKSVSVYIEKSCAGIFGMFPEQVKRWEDAPPEKAQKWDLDDPEAPDIAVGVRKYPLWNSALYLIPKSVVLGVGCRRGIEPEKIEEKVLRTLEENNIFVESVRGVSSIDLKAEEAGILKLCEKYKWEFKTFSAEVLEKAKGDFTRSEFVKEITGSDNVCERSAVCGSGGGDIILSKQAADGITIAAAAGRWEVRFE